jgi:CRISPR/Cas system CMR-associated protein Cmr1 (group 7 of RAMP superfamily)
LLVLVVCMAAEPALKPQQAVLVEEAEAVVELYETRLHNVNKRADQEDLKWNLVKDNFLSIEEAHRTGAINERDYREAKYNFEYWQKQDEIHDVIEAEIELKLARIRLKMVKLGMHPYSKIHDYGKD